MTKIGTAKWYSNCFIVSWIQSKRTLSQLKIRISIVQFENRSCSRKKIYKILLWCPSLNHQILVPQNFDHLVFVPQNLDHQILVPQISEKSRSPSFRAAKSRSPDFGSANSRSQDFGSPNFRHNLDHQKTTYHFRPRFWRFWRGSTGALIFCH